MKHALASIALFAAPCLGVADSVDMVRDPMQPPAAARAPVAAPAERSGSSATGDAAWRPRYLISSGGRRYLVQDSRRYGVGDALGAARIERIDDDAVWLREAGRLTRVSLFGDVAKRRPASAVRTSLSERKERQP